MKDIAELVVKQVRVYPAGSIPLNILSTKKSSEVLREGFSFRSIEWPMGPVSPQPLRLLFGSFGEKRLEKAINKLIIEERRIISEVCAMSNVADEFNLQLMHVIAGVCQDPMLEKLEPLVKSEVTTCVATFDFDLIDLFNQKFITFLESAVVKKAKSTTTEALFYPTTFRGKVTYTTNDPNLEHHAVTLSPQEIIIEPRAGTSSTVRRYHTLSPFDSETHLSILKELENTLAKRTQKRSKK